MEILGINLGEAVVLLLIATLVLGPKQIGSLFAKIRTFREQIAAFSQNARSRFQAETSLSADPVSTSPTRYHQLSESLPHINQKLNEAQAELKNHYNLSELGDPRAFIRSQVQEEMRNWIDTIEEVTRPDERKNHG